ncbi:uncharacterized protein ARMOST_13281 [Armillaria ostoyae]|uniref:C2H2-type domain-containing protein n=1 Tax=Armillaria ostoyae TaxID=47428 RepID=A0A284RMB5_ARMOS|nr:uncharacterized protein ARMOST_13281 [Armillaria ostoyae]
MDDLNRSNPPQALTNSHNDHDDNNDIIFNFVLADTPATTLDSLGQTFTHGDGNFSSNSSSTYSSPEYSGLGDTFDAIYDEWSPLSPQPSESWSQLLAVPSVPRLFSRRHSESGGSSDSSIDSSTDGYPGLRRHNSASSLGMSRNDQQILDTMSQNVGSMSLEDNRSYHDVGPRGRGGPGSSLSTGPSLSGSNTAFIIPIQTQMPDDLPYYWSPAPSPGSSSPISQNSSFMPTDGMAGNDNANLVRRRSARSVQASMNRRKSPGPGKFVCHICRDDFTTKHRLKGHIASKHEGKKLTCPSCNMVLSHGTSYDRHLKRTCPVLYPRNLT